VADDAGEAAYSLPALNSKAEQIPEKETLFWRELCELPQPLMRHFEAQRRMATAGVAQLLRRTGEPVPRCLAFPRPLR
ncbi:unnamed protein product, partial [Polarella glacialis]